MFLSPGGIGFDVAEFLSHDEHHNSSTNIDEYLAESVIRVFCGLMCRWGIDKSNSVRGGIQGIKPVIPQSPRKIFLLQRKTTKV